MTKEEIEKKIDEVVNWFYNHPDGNNICNGNDFGFGGLFIPEMRFKEFIEELKLKLKK